jgi:hypothetical protein
MSTTLLIVCCVAAGVVIGLAVMLALFVYAMMDAMP